MEEERVKEKKLLREVNEAGRRVFSHAILFIMYIISAYAIGKLGRQFAPDSRAIDIVFTITQWMFIVVGLLQTMVSLVFEVIRIFRSKA